MSANIIAKRKEFDILSKFINLVGQRFGRLIVKQRAVSNITRSGQHITKFLCICDCGNTVVVQARSLRDGKTKSCGCYRKEVAKNRRIKHNGSYSPLYAVHRAMKQRCENPNDRSYKWYGARGISVCDEWRDFKIFRKWAELSGYETGLTIERLDVNGNYCPENFTWITIQEQQKNRRRKSIQ